MLSFAINKINIIIIREIIIFKIISYNTVSSLLINRKNLVANDILKTKIRKRTSTETRFSVSKDKKSNAVGNKIIERKRAEFSSKEKKLSKNFNEEINVSG